MHTFIKLSGLWFYSFMKSREQDENMSKKPIAYKMETVIKTEDMSCLTLGRTRANLQLSLFRLVLGFLSSYNTPMCHLASIQAK